MIPKIIHYCWFGNNEKPKFIRDFISTWKKNLPDYEIKEWNESNSPIDKYPFAKQALENRKYAFVSDIIRLHALYNEGGIYLDTDVEVLKSFDKFLKHKVFCGFEKDIPGVLQTAVIGAEPQQPFIKDCLDAYANKTFEISKMASIVNNKIYTRILQEKGIRLDGSFVDSDYITLYPYDYFSPMSYGTHYIEKTKNTVCIHYYTFSWSKPDTLKGDIKVFVAKIIGEKNFRMIVNRVRKLLRLR